MLITISLIVDMMKLFGTHPHLQLSMIVSFKTYMTIVQCSPKNELTCDNKNGAISSICCVWYNYLMLLFDKWKWWFILLYRRPLLPLIISPFLWKQASWMICIIRRIIFMTSTCNLCRYFPRQLMMPGNLCTYFERQHMMGNLCTYFARQHMRGSRKDHQYMWVKVVCKWICRYTFQNLPLVAPLVEGW